MTRTWRQRRSRRADTGRRAALRAKLFAQFFLPPPEEITDPALLSQLSAPIDLDAFKPPDRKCQRITRVRAQVSRFRAVNHQQRQLRCLILEMLDYMARELQEPANELALEEWWAAVVAYRRVLELPVMATPKARTLLPKIIDAQWPDVGKAAASLARKWGSG